MRVFTLWTSLATVQARERARIGRAPLGAAVEECYREIAEHADALGTIVDAEGPSAAALAEQLAAQLSF